jgi:molecular chaperone DnaJ
MNLSEAYKILELNESASEEEVSKQFKKMAAKYHPDVNKDPGALEMSKKISEANNVIKTAPKKSDYDFSTSGFPGVVGDVDSFISSIFGGGGFGPGFGFGNVRVSSRVHRQQQVESSIKLTFPESILGCQKQIELEKYIKCDPCRGEGFIYDKNDCTSCKGKGFTTVLTNQRSLCTTCQGLGKIKTDCSVCNKVGSFKTKTSLTVNLPGGIESGSKLKLSGQGNFVKFNGSDYYEDAFVNVTVAPDSDMRLSGIDVISSIDITLLEALQGLKKDVKTVKGSLPLQVPKLTKDKDRISLAGAGVNPTGSHVFIVNVKYPNDIDGLIKYLKKEE